MSEAPESRKQRIAELVASTIDESIWFGVSTKKKVGVALFALGGAVFPLAFLGFAPGPIFWSLAGLGSVGFGIGLALGGTGFAHAG